MVLGLRMCEFVTLSGFYLWGGGGVVEASPLKHLASPPKEKYSKRKREREEVRNVYYSEA